LHFRDRDCSRDQKIVAIDEAASDSAPDGRIPK
jgi:hypothetical protein